MSHLWLIDDPGDERYASASFQGTWQGSGGGLCKECGAHDEVRVSPLILEWQAGSEVIGDFTWDGIADQSAIKASAAERLGKSIAGFSLGPVEMIQAKRLKRPTRPNRRTRPRVWLPYEGPPIYELLITRMVHVDMAKSSLRLEQDCSTCGRKHYKLRGAGQILQNARKNNCGLYVRQENVSGATFFRAHEWCGWILCTNEARTVIEDLALTNIAFKEVGEVC